MLCVCIHTAWGGGEATISDGEVRGFFRGVSGAGGALEQMCMLEEPEHVSIIRECGNICESPAVGELHPTLLLV